MCFRPAEADAGVHPVACGGCGRTVFPVEGILPSKCPFCHEPLGANATAQAPAPRPTAPAAPGAPAPQAPKAPGAPAPQAAPAPKAPATPGAPPTPAMAKPQ